MTLRGLTALLWILGLGCLWGCGGDGSTLGPDGQPLATDGDTDDDGHDDDDDDDDGDDNGDNGGTPAVTLARLSDEIFTPNCAVSGCHAGSFLSANMSLEADKIAENIIDVPSNQDTSLKRIDPGNPDGSYLIRKVQGTGAVSQMPLGRTPLSPAQIQLIIDWVAAGAPL